MSSFSNGGTLVNLASKLIIMVNEHTYILHVVHLFCKYTVPPLEDVTRSPVRFFSAVLVASPAQFRAGTRFIVPIFIFIFFLPSRLGQPGTRAVSRCGDAHGSSGAKRSPIGEPGTLFAKDPCFVTRKEKWSHVLKESHVMQGGGSLVQAYSVLSTE